MVAPLPQAVAPFVKLQTMTGILVVKGFAKVTVHVPVDPGVPVPVLMVPVKAVSLPATVGLAGLVPVPVQEIAGAEATDSKCPVLSTRRTSTAVAVVLGVTKKLI